MRNLEELCESEAYVMSTNRTGITYLIPNFNPQFLRVWLIETPGPISASNLLKETVTELLSAVELWVMCMLMKTGTYH